MLLSIKLQYNNHLILYNFEYQCMYVYLHMFYTLYVLYILLSYSRFIQNKDKTHIVHLYDLFFMQIFV